MEKNLKGEKKMDFKMIIILLIYIALSVGGLVVFKLGTQKELAVGFSNGSLNINVNLYVILGLIFYVCSFLIYMFLVSKFDLSYIAPISMGLAQVATVGAAILIFKDKLTTYQLIGIALIIVGVVLTNIKKS